MRRVRLHKSNTEKQRLYRNAILIAVGGNFLLAVVKGLIAWISGSSAVFSDAANSLSDALYSVLMGLGLYISQRPADQSHPQGHGQIEPIISIFIAFTMGLAGVISFWKGIQGLLTKPAQLEIVWPTFVLIGAISIKLIMYIYMSKIGESSQSPVIRASAQDNLVDIFSSTAALIGLWGSHFIHPAFDPIAGIFVAIWIFKASGEILWENIGYLTGRGAPEHLTDKIVQQAKRIDEIDNVHHVIAEYVGPQLRVDIHINVNGDITLTRAHDISEAVKEKIQSLDEVDLVFVHVEPTMIEKQS